MDGSEKLQKLKCYTKDIQSLQAHRKTKRQSLKSKYNLMETLGNQKRKRRTRKQIDR